MTAIRASHAATLNLNVTETDKQARGIGGATRRKVTVIPRLAAGPVDLGLRQMAVLPLDVLADKKAWGGYDLIGVLGSDVFTHSRWVIDIP